MRAHGTVEEGRTPRFAAACAGLTIGRVPAGAAGAQEARAAVRKPGAMRLSTLLACLLAFLLWACAAPAQRADVRDELRDEAGSEDALEAQVPEVRGRSAPWEADGFRRGETDGGTLVAWRPLGGELPRNRHFDLEVWIVRAGEPVRGAELLVRADMPEHGHGMNVEPRAYAQSDGSYRVRGLLLHMGGRWELALHVVEPGRFQRAVFELEL
jgi:hypothetical protein